MQFKRLALAISALALWSGAAFAQDDPSARQLEAMARLAPLAGEWVVTGQIMGPNGAQPMPSGSARAHYAFNDRGIEEMGQLTLGDGGAIQMRTLFSYDPYREIYRLSIMDDAYGLLDIYEGDFDEDGRLVTTNLRSDTSFPIPSGQLHFKLVHDFSTAEGHAFEVYLSTDRGESWQLYFDRQYAPAN